MNKTKIEWADYTWNPVTGCLGPRGDGVRCSYCYANRLAHGRLKKMYWEQISFTGTSSDPFAPRWWPERLEQPFTVLKPSRIFVVDMGDLFGDWVSSDIQEHIIRIARHCSWHTFLFLTKWPQNLAQFNPWPKNCWVGATATDQESWDHALDHLKRVEASVRYVSLEPFLGDVVPHPNHRLDWLIVGVQTGPGAHPPLRGHVQTVLGWAQYRNVPMFLKDNLHWPERRQEYPD